MAINLISPTTFTTAVLIGDTSQAPGGSNDIPPSLTTVNVGGIEIPAASALEIQSTVCALLLPRLTQAQIDAITATSTPAATPGLTVYNTTTNTLNMFTGAAWQVPSGGTPSFPLLAPDGSKTAPSYSFTNSTGSGMYLSNVSPTHLSFSAAGAKTLELMTTVSGASSNYLQVTSQGAGNPVILSSEPSGTADMNISIQISPKGAGALLTPPDTNVGIGTTTFGTAAKNVIGIANGTTVPTSAPMHTIQLYSVDFSGTNAGSTLGIWTTQTVGAAPAAAATASIQIFINGIQYSLPLYANIP